MVSIFINTQYTTQIKLLPNICDIIQILYTSEKNSWLSGFASKAVPLFHITVFFFFINIFKINECQPYLNNFRLRSILWIKPLKVKYSILFCKYLHDIVSTPG